MHKNVCIRGALTLVLGAVIALPGLAQRGAAHPRGAQPGMAQPGGRQLGGSQPRGSQPDSNRISRRRERQPTRTYHNYSYNHRSGYRYRYRTYGDNSGYNYGNNYGAQFALTGRVTRRRSNTSFYLFGGGTVYVIYPNAYLPSWLVRGAVVRVDGRLAGNAINNARVTLIRSR